MVMATCTSIGWIPTPKIPDNIQAILNKPVPNRSPEETASLHKHFEQGVKTPAQVRSG